MNQSVIGDNAVNQSVGGNIYTSILILLVMVVAFYFLYLRPQKKRDKEYIKMRDSLKIGDVVITIGGIVGIITSIKEDVLILETGNDKNKVRIKKWAIKEVENIEGKEKKDSDTSSK